MKNDIEQRIDVEEISEPEPTAPNALKLLFYLFAWYFTSAALSIFNKKLLGRSEYNFNFPFLTSALQSLSHYNIISIIIKVAYSETTIKVLIKMKRH